MEMKRRGFLFALGAALAAPAVVRAEIIMPVKRIILPPQAGLRFVSKGFPTRGAPLGSKWLQDGLTHRIEWTMGADGYWAPGPVEAKTSGPPWSTKFHAHQNSGPLPDAPNGSIWVEDNASRRVIWTKIGEGHWSQGEVLEKRDEHERLSVELRAISPGSMLHEVQDDFKWEGRRDQLVAHAVEQEMRARSRAEADTRCPDFAAEDRRATEMRWNARAEQRFGQGAVWRSAAPITGG